MIFGLLGGRRDLGAFASRHVRPPAERWSPVPEALDRAIAADRDLAAAAAGTRRDLVSRVTERLAGLVPGEEVARLAAPLLSVPRERFVLPEEIASSGEDIPSPLDRAGLATVSAPHAYVLTYWLLDLRDGHHLVELGTGTGYGAAIASHLVGPAGRVTSIEIDPDLHVRARRLLADPSVHGAAPIVLLSGDARALALDVVTEATKGPRPLRIAVTYALPEAPEELLQRLPEGGKLAAPVAIGAEDQLLVRWTREHGALRQEDFGAVRYVSERR